MDTGIAPKTKLIKKYKSLLGGSLGISSGNTSLKFGKMGTQGIHLVVQYLITFIHKLGFLIVKNKVNIL